LSPHSPTSVRCTLPRSWGAASCCCIPLPPPAAQHSYKPITSACLPLASLLSPLPTRIPFPAYCIHLPTRLLALPNHRPLTHHGSFSACHPLPLLCTPLSKWHCSAELRSPQFALRGSGISVLFCHPPLHAAVHFLATTVQPEGEYKVKHVNLFTFLVPSLVFVLLSSFLLGPSALLVHCAATTARHGHRMSPHPLPSSVVSTDVACFTRRHDPYCHHATHTCCLFHSWYSAKLQTAVCTEGECWIPCVCWGRWNA
jgi:hypothetical protein